MSEARWSDGTDGGAAAAPKRTREQCETTPEREARVAELREQYLNGTYQVDAARLSAAIIDEHLRH